MMEKKVKKMLLCVLVNFWLVFQGFSQGTSLYFQEPDFRSMPISSQIKGIYTISENRPGGLYLRHDSNGEGVLATFDETDERFYFWIVENRFEGYFQVYSTAEKGAALQVTDSGGASFSTETTDESTGEVKKVFRLQWRMPASGPLTSEADRMAGIVAKAYLTTVTGTAGTNTPDCNCKILKPNGGGTNNFVIRKLDFEVDSYYPITFEKADELGNVNSGTIEEDLANRWVRIKQLANGKKNNFVSSKFYVIDFGENDFRVTIEAGTEGTIGFVDYNRHEFASSVYKLAVPKVGIKVHNGNISLIYGGGGQELPRSNVTLFGGEVPTNFVVGQPIVFGFEGQESLVAYQNETSYRLPLNSPTEFFLNQSITQSVRMLVQLEEGDVKLSYTLENGLVNLRENFGADDGANYYSSDAFFPHAPNGEVANTFDWTQTKWPVRYQDNGIQEQDVFSPFYQSGTFYNSISAKFSPTTGAYEGGEDFSNQEGWELVKADLGYNADGSVRPQPPILPYVMLYDRVLGTLRVMVYAKNEGEANLLTLSLNTENNTEYRPRMWGGMAQFASLDQVVPSAFSQPMTFFSSSGRQWYFADFYMEFDPCVCFFESNFTLEVYKETKGDLSIIGRLAGGSIPAGTDAYNNWTEHREDYLTGVMDNDFGSLENSLGTTVFNQYREFDMMDYSNEISGLLTGAEIEDWEKEAARLEWLGTRQSANAEISIGAAQVVEGGFVIAEGASTISNIFNLPFFKPGEATAGASQIAQGAAVIAQGSATIASGEGNLKVARAAKMHYDAIKDKVREDDQEINLTAPEPRPNVVFGDLALQGTLTITTKLLRDGDGRTVTPGGKDPCTGPGCEWYANGLLGNKPLYHKPLGNFNLLNQPKFGVAIVENDGQFRAYLKIKEKPYFVHNNSTLGKIDDMLGLAIQVETKRSVVNSDGMTDYQSAGLASPREGFSTLIGHDGGLVGEHDITNLIDWGVIQANMASNPNIHNELSKWLNISYKVSSLTMSSLITRDLNRAFAEGSFIYEGETTFVYGTSQAVGNGLYAEAKEIAAADPVIATYNFADRVDFGNNYNVYYSDFSSTAGELYQAMNNYCSSLQAGFGAARKAEQAGKQLSVAKEEGQRLAVYPNPAETKVNFRLGMELQGEAVIALFDIDGRKLIESRERLVKGHRLEGAINVQPLSSGLYILKVWLPNGEVINKKIIRK